MRPLVVSCAFVVVATLVASCDEVVPCADPGTPTEIDGAYQQAAGTAAFSDATLDVTADEVVVDYTTPDGSRFRARYAIER